VVSALLHYSLLSAMFWMAVEAFNMYLAFVRVYGAGIPHIFLKYSLFAWGMPCVIVATTLAATMTDGYARLRNGICWLRGVAFYVAFVAPVALMIILNFIVFGIVLRVIVGKAHKKLGRSDAHSTLRRLRRAVGVVILLGLTWVFGFMAVGEVKLIMQYLFVVFNSLQGLFIFLFYCVMNREVHKALSHSAVAKERTAKTSLSPTRSVVTESILSTVVTPALKDA
ncbi:hypothetical protein BaRGS_00026402, partial [Batillaria attramentaria]